MRIPGVLTLGVHHVGADHDVTQARDLIRQRDERGDLVRLAAMAETAAGMTDRT
jgi:hypothetical protein